MKPGKATMQTITDAILTFETSRRADRKRSKQGESIQHRELRRQARRLAKMALAQREALRKLHDEVVQLRARGRRLENEIDRLDPQGNR